MVEPRETNTRWSWLLREAAAPEAAWEPAPRLSHSLTGLLCTGGPVPEEAGQQEREAAPAGRPGKQTVNT